MITTVALFNIQLPFIDSEFLASSAVYALLAKLVTFYSTEAACTDVNDPEEGSTLGPQEAKCSKYLFLRAVGSD